MAMGVTRWQVGDRALLPSLGPQCAGQYLGTVVCVCQAPAEDPGVWFVCDGDSPNLPVVATRSSKLMPVAVVRRE